MDNKKMIQTAFLFGTIMSLFGIILTLNSPNFIDMSPNEMVHYKVNMLILSIVLGMFSGVVFVVVFNFISKFFKK